MLGSGHLVREDGSFQPTSSAPPTRLDELFQAVWLVWRV